VKKDAAWNDDRLTRLFARYQLRYWPASRRLNAYRIRASSLEGDAVRGRCDFEARVLHVDLSHHLSDRELRATVLHEMIHAVVGRGGHHAPFWTQLEYLLSRNAPLTVGFPELGERGPHLRIIPPRYRRSRRLFRLLYERQQRAIERMKLQTVALRPKDIENECENAALAGVIWHAIWPHQASTYGLVDLDGRVLPSARPYQVAARRGYVRGRRAFLEEERRREQFARTTRRARATSSTPAGRVK
jgi:hypothetical protein